MKWFKNLFKAQSTTETQSDSRVFSFLSRGKVTSQTAQRISWVFGCINIKANALSTIPLKLYINSSNGKEDGVKHPLYNLLSYEPNPNLTSYEWKKMISQDLDLRGNHYCQIIRNGLGDVVALYPLQADLMRIEFTNQKEKIYKYNNTQVPASRILHIIDIPDHIGLYGISRISYNLESLEFAQNTATHGNKIFKNGVTPTGAFEHPTELSDAAYKRLADSLEEKYSGLENSGKPLLLEGGLKFSPLTIKNSDAQWLESRKLNREEIATIFGVPSSMLNDTANTAYTNLEQKYLEFQTNTILPICIAIEQKCRQQLLSPNEKNILSIKFKFNSLLRTDAQSRAEFYRTLWNIGAISPNEIRSLEDMNSYDGGDNYFIQTANATVDNIIKGTNE